MVARTESAKPRPTERTDLPMNVSGHSWQFAVLRLRLDRIATNVRGIVFSQFDRVVVTTGDFEDLGVPHGATCFILDLYPDGGFELDYTDADTGATIVFFSARADQIAPAD
ncbi:hypothetical protein JK358_14920 [Nocardia sp. 2]|uniref:Uncharacterized protein n=1 Tax=Nocardia acididurans TaxID=2802282 RepID=A0ABS1M552_9NOCA|nr:hypothetical protein [Nocardia acididurans]MBL1075686.1 hypothetical protein [Nocardia acididurans]